ncbi:hypothetical protein O181_021298 [Austropuccinia psidii MF-1]|uniref:Integrase catalytic domain-containing protein n=1 Tax=Austropuccinia psidii MF-1 TaxID=1389203 RepID=A0A9Q3GVB5_9BASI|nr:hypothetical protein [Austropuccinia psidii MF-1]
MKRKGIGFEQGPSNSPQTNGVAECFNQSLPSKMHCLIGQSNIPTYLWNEAASHASFILNQLPHKFSNFKSPMDKLDEFNCRIEPKINLKNILPFGIKVVIKSNTTNKIDMPGKIIRALTFEKYSDALRVLNIKTGQIKITRDYEVSSNQVKGEIHKPEYVLPHESSSRLILKLPHQDDSQKQALPPQTNDIETQNSTTSLLSSYLNKNPSNKNYQYVPFYDKPPNHISSTISSDNIIEGRRNRNMPDLLLLTDTIPYNQAIFNDSEKQEWKKAMDNEFNSLMNHNTGILVTYLKNNEKVIGGMWCLTRKGMNLVRYIVIRHNGLFLVIIKNIYYITLTHGHL